VFAASQVHSYDVCFYIAAAIIFVAGISAVIVYPSGWRPVTLEGRERALAG
jgi:hypothetical protein